MAQRHAPQMCAPLPNALAEDTFRASVEAHTAGVPIIRSRAFRAERWDLHPDVHDPSISPVGLKPQDCLHSTMAAGAFDGEVSQLLEVLDGVYIDEEAPLEHMVRATLRSTLSR